MDTVPTLSDNSTVLLIMITVAMFIFFPTAYFGGKKSLIIAVCILTGLTAFVYLYALGLGRSFANSNASGAIDSSQLIMFVLFTCFYLIMAYGHYILVQTIKGEGSYGIQLLIWLGLCFAYPIFDYASQSYKYNQYLEEQKKYYEARIIIAHPIKFPILIDNIRFLNAQSGSTSVMDDAFYRDDEEIYVYDFERLRGESEENLKEHVYYAISNPERSHLKIPLKVPVDFDAFELSSLLTDNQTPAKAKPGDLAPEDIEIEAGPTELIPGPAISELSSVGLKVAVENGKLAIKQGRVVSKKGDEIDEKTSSVLAKLNILPMQVGFEPVAAYDKQEDKLYEGIKIDKKGTLENLREMIGKALGFGLCGFNHHGCFWGRQHVSGESGIQHHPIAIWSPQ